MSSEYGDYNTPMPFDLVNFGKGLRAERIKAGYKSSTKFREEMERLTGYELSRDTLYKIESGDREMKITLLWAWSVTLYGRNDWYKGVNRLMRYGYVEKMHVRDFDMLMREFDERMIDIYEYSDAEYMDRNLGSLVLDYLNKVMVFPDEIQEQERSRIIGAITELAAKDLSNQEVADELRRNANMLRLIELSKQPTPFCVDLDSSLRLIVLNPDDAQGKIPFI